MFALDEEIRAALCQTPYDELYEYARDGEKNEKRGKINEGKAALRWMCQTDLYFLSKNIFRKDLIETGGLTGRGHREITDFFVHKRPPEPGEDWKQVFAGLDSIKNRLLLWPRNTYKSTIDVMDAVQWVINFPDIRVLFLTGDKGLAKTFVNAATKCFVREGEPTLFQYLFPEHAIRPDDEYEDYYQTPARRDGSLLQPSISGSSLESSLSGRHYDVMKPDDAVTNENSQTPQGIAKIVRNFFLNKKMLMPYGYCDGIGTRYDDLDLWGVMIERARSFTKKHGEDTLKYMCAAAWWPVQGSEYKEEWEMTKADYHLLLPTILSYDFLIKEQHDDPKSFNSQYLNKPDSKRLKLMDEQIVRDHTITYDMMPQKFRAFIRWDLSYSSGGDYNVVAVGLLDELNRLFFAEVSRFRVDKDGPALARKIAEVYARWGPEVCRVEDSVGSRWLETDIIKAGIEMNVEIRITWALVSNKKGIKDELFNALATPMKDNRLWFVNTIECYDDLMAEFTSATPHNDIRDVIGHLVDDVLPRGLQAIPEKDEDMFQKAWDLMREKERHDLIFCAGEHAPKPPAPPTPQPVSNDTYQVRQYYGFPGQTPEEKK